MALWPRLMYCSEVTFIHLIYIRSICSLLLRIVAGACNDETCFFSYRNHVTILRPHCTTARSSTGLERPWKAYIKTAKGDIWDLWHLKRQPEAVLHLENFPRGGETGFDEVFLLFQGTNQTKQKKKRKTSQHWERHSILQVTPCILTFTVLEIGWSVQYVECNYVNNVAKNVALRFLPVSYMLIQYCNGRQKQQ